MSKINTVSASPVSPVSPVAHLATLTSANVSPANQFNGSAAVRGDSAGFDASRAKAVAAARRTNPSEKALNLDPRKLAVIQDTIAYVVDSKRILDKSVGNIAKKVAMALNKAGVPSEGAEHIWTTASSLAEMNRLDAAGKL